MKKVLKFRKDAGKTIKDVWKIDDSCWSESESADVILRAQKRCAIKLDWSPIRIFRIIIVNKFS